MRAYRVAYDGRPYYGFQRQPDVPTVEDELLDALRRLDALAGDVPEAYAAAGRTDAGVSALAQTVAFDAPDWLTPAAFNSELPADVRVWASADVREGFHATHDAHAREYTYYLHAPAADDALAEDAAAALSGEHDFHNLTPDADGTVRDLRLSVERDGPFLVLGVRAGGFARHLVRRLAALVADVADGAAPLARIDRVLAAQPLSGAEAVGTAPPHPLVLTAVAYEGVAFEGDPDAAASARTVFAERRAEQLTRARVAGRICDGIE